MIPSSVFFREVRQRHHRRTLMIDFYANEDFDRYVYAVDNFLTCKIERIVR